MIKDVFCIDPDGELKGKSFGLTSKNKGWVMKAPVVFLSGSVRNREEAFPGDAPNGNEMVVDVLAGEEVEPVVPTEKRRCLEEPSLEGSNSNPCINPKASLLGGSGFGADLLQQSILQLRAPCQDPQSGGLSVSIPSSALMVGETSGRKSIKEFELSRPLSSVGPLSIVGPAKGTDEASIKLNPMALNKVKPTMGFDYILKGAERVETVVSSRRSSRVSSLNGVHGGTLKGGDTVGYVVGENEVETEKVERKGRSRGFPVGARGRKRGGHKPVSGALVDSVKVSSSNKSVMGSGDRTHHEP